MNVSAVVLSVAAALLPVAASAQSLPSPAQRQAILNVEYQLNQPGVPAASEAALQQRVATLESTANGTTLPTLAVPVYGSCAADQSIIAYLQDDLVNGELDTEQQQTDRTAIYDLQVNLHQRGC